MAQIHALSSKPANAKDMQQMVRWVNTKEDHASKVIKTIAEYFLTQKQATGVTSTESNQMVHIHRGNIGDTDATGGISDVDSRIHRWLNPVAKVTVTVK